MSSKACFLRKDRGKDRGEAKTRKKMLELILDHLMGKKLTL
jgi:hypothetical protein